MSIEFDKDAGIAGGVNGANQAANAAGEEWKESARALFIEFAKTQTEFQTEDARQYAHDVKGLTYPPDSRAWGLIVRQQFKAGNLERLRYEGVKDRKCHAGPKPFWKWIGANPEKTSNEILPIIPAV